MYSYKYQHIEPQKEPTSMHIFNMLNYTFFLK